MVHISDVTGLATFVAGAKTSAATMNANFSAITDVINGGLDDGNFPEGYVFPASMVDDSVISTKEYADGIVAALAATAGFVSDATISANGRLLLGNGLELKWGTVTTTAGFGGSDALVFPAAFANACFCVFATKQVSSVSGFGIGVGSLTRFGCTLWDDGGTAGGFTLGTYYYFAVGN